jgi:cellobiose-specific phosphotransferase system component IIB
MLRIAISCGEGFSSGFLAKHLQDEVLNQKMQDTVSFIRIPYYDLAKRQDEVDIAMIMPHIEWKLKCTKYDFHIPLYVIPYKAMLRPTLQDYIEDAQDILKLANGCGGRFCFSGEERTAFVSRTCSHRAMMANKEKQETEK